MSSRVVVVVFSDNILHSTALCVVIVVIVLLHGIFCLRLLQGALNALLWTSRKVLFIVTSEIIYRLLIQFNATIGQKLYIFYYHLVVGVLLIVFETL